MSTTGRTALTPTAAAAEVAATTTVTATAATTTVTAATVTAGAAKGTAATATVTAGAHLSEDAGSHCLWETSVGSMWSTWLPCLHHRGLDVRAQNLI